MNGLPFLTGRYGCPLCASRFASLHDKKAHLRTEHPKPVSKR